MGGSSCSSHLASCRRGPPLARRKIQAEMVPLHGLNTLVDLETQTKRKENSVSLSSLVSRCWPPSRCKARMHSGWGVQKDEVPTPKLHSTHRQHRACAFSALPCLPHTPGHCYRGSRAGLSSSQPLPSSSLGVLSQLTPAFFQTSSGQAQARNFPK